MWSDLRPVLDLTAERPVKTAPGPLGSPFPAAGLQGLQLPQSDSLVRAMLLDSSRRARWGLLGKTAQATHRTVKHRGSVGACPPSPITTAPHARNLTGSVPAFGHWAKILAQS